MWLASTVDHHGFTLDVNQALLFHVLEYATNHLSGAAGNTGYLLSGGFYLHAVGMGHGIRLFAEIK